LAAQEAADTLKLKYFETSAKTGRNVDLVFESMAQNIISKIEKNELDFTNDVRGYLLANLSKSESNWEHFIKMHGNQKIMKMRNNNKKKGVADKFTTQYFIYR
jgi:Ras-related protein Rab-2A